MFGPHLGLLVSRGFNDLTFGDLMLWCYSGLLSSPVDAQVLSLVSAHTA